MAATATYISSSSSILHLRKSKNNNYNCTRKSSINALFSVGKSLNNLNNSLICLRNSKYSSSQWRRRKSYRYTSPVMEWQDCSSEIEVDIPCSLAYQCYSDREAIPQWMPFISSVSIVKDKPDLSKWSLKYEVFGRDVEFSWLARNLKPILNQKIHWRSLEGLPNRGAVRFFPKGPSSCRVQLTVSYEIPQVLAPVASALKPFLEGLLSNGLERFAKVAKNYESLPKIK
ncbi:hypothetical protein LUZ60_011548 [Juncus effusus]|nr:hypothetical protein LUZ60_011548 [Juncus effusus]